MKFLNKRSITLVVSFCMFILYFMLTDPDANLVSNLPFGVQIVLLLSILILSALCITFMETFTDIYTDEIAADEKDLAKMASNTSEGSGLVLQAKSIRLLAYAIIIGTVIISTSAIM
jgi:hypothetical protein